MKKTLLASSLLLLSMSSVQAADAPRWDMGSVSYQSSSYDEETLTGFAVSGSKLITDDIFVSARYDNISEEIESIVGDFDINIATLSAGLGYRYAIMPNTDLYGVVSYESVSSKLSFDSESLGENTENGYGLKLGARSKVIDNVELASAISYVYIDGEGEAGIDLSAMYDFTDYLSAGVGYEKTEHTDTASLTGYFFF